MKIVIVGAGLLGRLIAWRLLEERAGDLDVCLIDKDLSGHSSAAYVAAAMVAPMSELIESEPVVANKGLLSLGLWQKWALELSECYEQDIAFQRNGSIVVAHHADQGDLNRFVRTLSADLVKTDIPASSLIPLDRRGIANLEPSLSRNFNQAYWLSDEGALDNHALLIALKHVLLSKGVKMIEHELSSQDYDALSDSSSDKSFSLDELNQADIIVNSLGFSGKQSLPDGMKSFRGVRGEVLRVKATEVSISRPVRLMHPRYQLYIAPKPNHEYVIGATQIESESEEPITIRSSMELLSALYSVDKGFSEAQLVSSDAKCRPAFSDNLPAIRWLAKGGRGLLSVNGLYRHGYLLSPVVVEQVLSALSLGGQDMWPELMV